MRLHLAKFYIMLKQTKYIAILIPIIGFLIITGIILIKIIIADEIFELWRILFAVSGFLFSCLLTFYFAKKLMI